MPSMQAPASPRRPTRRMQRTRLSLLPISFTASAVPSGELSSTKIASQAMPASAWSSRRTSSATLPHSLKVGMTIESWALGKPGRTPVRGVLGDGPALPRQEGVRDERNWRS